MPERMWWPVDDGIPVRKSGAFAAIHKNPCRWVVSAVDHPGQVVRIVPLMLQHGVVDDHIGRMDPGPPRPRSGDGAAQNSPQNTPWPPPSCEWCTPDVSSLRSVLAFSRLIVAVDLVAEKRKSPGKQPEGHSRPRFWFLFIGAPLFLYIPVSLYYRRSGVFARRQKLRS